MHRARDSRGRFLARTRSSIFTSPSASRDKQETPPLSPTETPSPEIQEPRVDSLIPSIEFELGRDSSLSPTRKPIVIEEIDSPEEEGEISSHSPFVEEPEDFEIPRRIIMAEEEGGGRGRGRGGGGNNNNNGGGRGPIGGNRDGDNSFGFPIVNEDSRATMKNISPSVLPNFHGLRTEDPETFLFEFEVVCRTYDYLDDTQKLKLFPSTLKGQALK